MRECEYVDVDVNESEKSQKMSVGEVTCSHVAFHVTGGAKTCPMA